MLKFISQLSSLLKSVYLFFNIIIFFTYSMFLEMVLLFSLIIFIFFTIMVLYFINFFKIILKFFYSNVFKLIEGFYTLTIYSYVRFIYYYLRFRIFLISFVLFLSIFTFIFYSMDSKIPTAEEAFIKVIIGYIFSWCIICITLIVLNVLKILFTILFKWLCKKFGNIAICLGELFTYDNFLVLYNILLSFSKTISQFRFRGSGQRFSSSLLNCLNKFSIILYKYIIGFIIKLIVLLILEMFENIFLLVLLYFYLFWLVLSGFLVFLFNKFVSFLFYLWTSRIYVFTFGRIEGLIYRFWINNMRDSFSYLASNLESFYSVDVRKVGLFMVIINFISILITLICIFYSSSIYVVTIGLHMDVSFKFILNRCDGISFVPFFILSSFIIFYIISIIFFISCLFLSVILILRFYYCSLILFNKLFVFLLAIQGCYFHFKSYIIIGVVRVDTKFIKESWDSIEEVFKYDELFANKVLEVQEDRLDKEDQKKDPNKFYYKRLFVNLVAFLSFSFVFVIMFICFYYF